MRCIRGTRHVPGLRLATILLVLALAGCASKPPPPDWQMNAHASMRRALEAYLSGDSRVEALEMDRARAEIARTGRPALLARAELMRCAAQAASLAGTGCPAFDELRVDADAADASYARYLTGALLEAADRAKLPAAQQAFAAPRTAGPADGAALAQIEDPLSRLVAAAGLLQQGGAHPSVLVAAADTASAQGWRRPLAAWLQALLQRAEAAGDAEEAARLRRRLALVLPTPRASGKR